MHSSTLYLLSGLKVSIFDNKSRAKGFAFGYKDYQDYFDRLGNDFMYFNAFSFPIYDISSTLGVPKTAMIL